MNLTYGFLRSNRKWLIKDYTIWGKSDNLQADMFFVESIGSSSRIIFHHQFSGTSPQIVNFADLTDHRGNNLPATLNNAEVIIIGKNHVRGYLLGDVGSSSFRVAKDPDAPGDSIVDLLIMEMN